MARMAYFTTLPRSAAAFAGVAVVGPLLSVLLQHLVFGDGAAWEWTWAQVAIVFWASIWAIPVAMLACAWLAFSTQFGTGPHAAALVGFVVFAAPVLGLPTLLPEPVPIGAVVPVAVVVLVLSVLTGLVGALGAAFLWLLSYRRRAPQRKAQP